MTAQECINPQAEVITDGLAYSLLSQTFAKAQLIFLAMGEVA